MQQLTALPQTKFATQINKGGSAGRSDDHLGLLAAGFRFILPRALSIQSFCNGLYLQTHDLCCYWIGPAVASCFEH